MTKKTYKQLQSELNDVLETLQDDNLDIDEAFKNYEKGEKILKELNEVLKAAENKVKKIT